MLTREKFIESPVEIKFELLHFFNKKDPLIVFDIGACEAEDSIRYADLFPDAAIYAFEPRLDNYQKGQELIRQYNKTNIIFENIALSNKNGTAEFHLSEGEPESLRNDEHWNYGNKSSSLLPPSEELKKHTGWLTFEKKIIVQTKTLASYVSEKNISTIDFMHIDVQGAELMVLEGAGSFCNKVKIIWMEVEAIRLYKNQPLKDEVEYFMNNKNFINVLDTVNQVSGDQLYINSLYFPDDHIKRLFAKRKKQKRFSRLKSFLKF